MKKINKLLLGILFFSPFKYLYCQLDSSFSVVDFNNQRQVIKVKENWPQNRCFIILESAKKDTFQVNDVSEIVSKNIIMKKFLQIEFRIRGGSGIHLRVTKLFLIKNNKIFQALSLQTTYRYASVNRSENESYAVKFIPIQTNTGFKLKLIESGKNLDANKIQWTKQFTLLFDAANMVFYNKIEPKVRICKESQTKEKVFSVQLQYEKYIFLSNEWFQLRENCYELF